MFSREERGIMKLLVVMVALQNYHCRRRRCSTTVMPESTMAVAEFLRRLFHGGGWKTWRSYVEVLCWYGGSMRGGSMVIVSNGMMLWDEKQGAVWLNKFKHKAQLGAINYYRNIS